jgi:hypothetical protein
VSAGAASKPNGAAGFGRTSDGTIDPDDCRDWVLVRSVSGILLGRLYGRTREELDARPEVPFDLLPVYVFDARTHLIGTTGGVEARHHVDVQPAEWPTRGTEHVPWKGVTGPHSFLSDYSAEARKFVAGCVESVERSARAQRSGVVLAT